MDLLKNTLAAWAMHREFRAVLTELNGYSDRELSELGLTRADIPRVAYEEAERRIVTPAPSHAEAPVIAFFQIIYRIKLSNNGSRNEVHWSMDRISSRCEL